MKGKIVSILNMFKRWIKEKFVKALNLFYFFKWKCENFCNKDNIFIKIINTIKFLSINI